MQQPNIDYNVKTEDGETLFQAALSAGHVKFVEFLANEDSFDGWNVPDDHGETPIMWAVTGGNTEIVEILLRCPRVERNLEMEFIHHCEENNLDGVRDCLASGV